MMLSATKFGVPLHACDCCDILYAF